MKQTAAQKRETRRKLRSSALDVLAHQGWTSEKLKAKHKKAVFLLRGNNNPPVRVQVKTSQYAELGFSYRKDGQLNMPTGVSAVVASIWNHEKHPTHAVVSWFSIDAVAKAVADTKADREATGEVIQPGDVIWIRLHNSKGTGLGDVHPPLATVPLEPSTPDPVAETIAEAKVRVAAALHVRPDAVQSLSFYDVKLLVNIYEVLTRNKMRESDLPEIQDCPPARIRRLPVAGRRRAVL